MKNNFTPALAQACFEASGCRVDSAELVLDKKLDIIKLEVEWARAGTTVVYVQQTENEFDPNTDDGMGGYLAYELTDDGQHINEQDDVYLSGAIYQLCNIWARG